MVSLVNVNDPKEVERTRSQLRQKVTVPVNGNINRSSRPSITPETQLTLITYYNNILVRFMQLFNARGQMLLRDLAYYREGDTTAANLRAKSSNQGGDISKIQNVTIPIVQPQVESALAYLTSVFLSSYPIFGSVAPPDQQDAMVMMDTVVGEQSIKGCWPQELMKTLRNGLKYDLGACEIIWEEKTAARIDTPALNRLSTGTVKDVVYKGNYIYDISPYNLILDSRVSPDRNHIEGEIAGYSKIVSAVAMKQMMDDLDPVNSMNFRAAFESPASGADTNSQTSGVYIPPINPDALIPASQQQPFSWDTFLTVSSSAQNDNPIKYQSSYEWTTLYIRLIPSVFGMVVPNKNHVQIWKFILINRSTVIYAERQNNAHGYLPIIVCKPSNDGLSWQSKSFSQLAEPYQYVASALVNSAIESQRRKVYDRIYYDPSRVAKGDIDRVSSVARIPVKNSQYNKDIASAIHVSPYRDEGVSDILAFSQNVTQMADVANGQNRVTQGQFQKGNKTRQEFDTVMQNSTARPQMQALALEYTFFTPIKEIIKSNILQYSDAVTLVNSQSKAAVSIDPTVLRKALLSFKLSDGYLPSDKMVNGNLFGVMMQTAQALPEVRAEYDVMGMFEYQMKLQGADWLNQFKRTPQAQQQYMQMMMQANQAASAPKQPGSPAAAPAPNPGAPGPSAS